MDPMSENPGAPLEPHQLSPRRVKRRLIAALLALHAASLLAAVVLVVRARNDAPKARDGSAKSLLNLKPKDTVGWVSIRGPIMSSESGKPWERGAEQWARRIEQLAETKGVKAIVLDINSPGGSVGAVQEIYMRIQRVKKEKKIPFVALFGDVSASGGYYLGAACDKIVAHPGTLTGSIGVIFSVSNMEGLFAKVGYKQDPIKSGKHKDIGSPARPMTAEERAILQSLIDDAYGQFVQAVADGRKMTVEQVKPLADGRIYSGNQAKELGLVDVLGDSLDATKLAAELGGIKDEKPRVRRDAEKLNDIFEMLETRARLTFGLGAAGVTVSAGPSVPRGLLYAWSGGW
ncbi:MAG: signal peptide peptidase SppA [Elusimicrobia bacterium]|nr:signal peptide peptidase SppA [Elusimicrobiota bacterium]